MQATPPPAKHSAVPRRQPSSLRPPGSRFARVAAGVAHRLGGFIDTHITAIGGDGRTVEVTRWFYRQRMEAVLTPRCAPLVPAARCRHARAFVGTAAGAGAGRAGRGELPALRTTVTGVRAPEARRADNPARCQAALRRRRGMDQEAARRADSCRRSRRADSRLPARRRRVARQQQIAGRSGRRRASRCCPSSRT